MLTGQTQTAIARRCGWVAVALLLSTLSAGMLRAADPAEPARAGNPWIAIPGGIADTGGTAAYVTSVTDALEAFDMNNGQTLWDSKDAQTALALADGRVIAQAPRADARPNVMTILVLNAESGAVETRCQAIEFPDWIAVDGGIGLKFSCVAAVEGNELILTWHANRVFSAGAGETQTPEAVMAARRVDSGIARVDLTTGQSSVEVDTNAKPVKPQREPRFVDVGTKRITVSEQMQSHPGGVQVVSRNLSCVDRKNGRPLWQHEIASRVNLPNSLPTAPGGPNTSSKQPAPRR